MHDQVDITGAKCGACGQPLGLNATRRADAVVQQASTGDTPKATERVASALGKAVGSLRKPGGLRKAPFALLIIAAIAVGVAAWKPQYNPFESDSKRLRAAITDQDTFYLNNFHNYQRAPVRLETLQYAVANVAWHRDTFRALLNASHRGPKIYDVLNAFVNACLKGVKKQGAECSALPIVVRQGNIDRTDERAFLTLISFAGTSDPVKRTILRDTYQEFLSNNSVLQSLRNLQPSGFIAMPTQYLAA